MFKLLTACPPALKLSCIAALASATQVLPYCHTCTPAHSLKFDSMKEYGYCCINKHARPKLDCSMLGRISGWNWLALVNWQLQLPGWLWLLVPCVHAAACTCARSDCLRLLWQDHCNYAKCPWLGLDLPCDCHCNRHNSMNTRRNKASIHEIG